MDPKILTARHVVSVAEGFQHMPNASDENCWPCTTLQADQRRDSPSGRCCDAVVRMLVPPDSGLDSESCLQTKRGCENANCPAEDFGTQNCWCTSSHGLQRGKFRVKCLRLDWTKCLMRCEFITSAGVVSFTNRSLREYSPIQLQAGATLHIGCHGFAIAPI